MTYPEITNLDDLCDYLNELTDSRDVNMQKLPTFGGEAPEDTDGVWSWDATRLLIETDGEYEIVMRA